MRVESQQLVLPVSMWGFSSPKMCTPGVSEWGLCMCCDRLLTCPGCVPASSHGTVGHRSWMDGGWTPKAQRSFSLRCFNLVQLKLYIFSSQVYFSSLPLIFLIHPSSASFLEQSVHHENLFPHFCCLERSMLVCGPNNTSSKLSLGVRTATGRVESQ